LHVVFSQTRSFTVIALLMQICTRLQWCNAKRRFRIEGCDSLHLPVLSLLCAWARHLKTRTAHLRGQAICTCVRPASTKDCTSGNEARTQNTCAIVCLYVLCRIRILWLYHVQYCTMFL